MPPCTWIERSHAVTAASVANAFAAAAASGARSSLLGDAPRGPVDERARELDVRVRLRERVRDGLVGADRLAELLARLRVLDAEVERALRDAERLGCRAARKRGVSSTCVGLRRARGRRWRRRRRPAPSRDVPEVEARGRARSPAPRAAAPPRRSRGPASRRRRASRAPRARSSGRPAGRPSRGRAGSGRRARRAPACFSSSCSSVSEKSISATSGRPSTRSAMMLRSTSEVPASIVLPRLRSCWWFHQPSSRMPSGPSSSRASFVSRWFASDQRSFTAEPSGPGMPVRCVRAERAVVRVAERLQLDPLARERLAHERVGVAARAPPRAAARTRRRASR